MTRDLFTLAFRKHFADLVGKPLLVALSGGADSVALLCLLAEARDELGSALTAAHVHHHLRGGEADADAAFCAELCCARAIPFLLFHLEPGCPRGASPEAWWREQRYRLLEEARLRGACAAVATAHTQDDQAETVLFKLLRGAGPRGVAGIRRRRGFLIRPLLDFRHDALERWLAARGLHWREDASNLTLERPRTWLRHRLLPLLPEAFPRAVEQLAAFAATLCEDEAFLATQLAARAVWPTLGASAPCAAVAAMAAALRRRWVLELASRLPLAEPPSREQLEAVERMVLAGKPRAVDLGRGWVLRRRGERLHLSPPPCRPFDRQDASIPGELTLPGGFRARLGVTVPEPGALHAWLHPRSRDAPLAFRSVRSGERWPNEHAERLARALASAGVPAEWRRAWPVLEAGGTIVWVPGLGVQEGWHGSPENGVGVELEEPWGGREKLLLPK